MMLPANVNRSTMAAQSRGSVKVLGPAAEALVTGDRHRIGLLVFRSTPEHLDDADFEKGDAVPGQRGSNRSLRALPGGSLAIALGSGLVADLLTIDELEKRALAVVQKIEDELEAELQGQVESSLEMMNSNR